jgi:hypothetical protein
LYRKLLESPDCPRVSKKITEVKLLFRTAYFPHPSQERAYHPRKDVHTIRPSNGMIVDRQHIPVCHDHVISMPRRRRRIQQSSHARLIV